MKKVYILGLISLSLGACTPNVEPESPRAGSADFGRYLAVGNSMTAGYADGALTRKGQENSFPQILAQQFTLVGGGEFHQPLLPGNAGFPSRRLTMQWIQGPCDEKPLLMPGPFTGAMDTSGSTINIAHKGPFHNQGIPGIRAIDYLTPGYALVNPYARRFFSLPMTRPLDEMMKVNPHFFTLWAGSNDVMLHAIDGGGNQAFPISSVEDFESAYDSLLNTLTRFGARGVILNIPSFAYLPYFNSLSIQGLMLSQREANDLNVKYNGTGMRFVEGANYYVVEDPGETAGYRQLRKGEYLLLSVPMDSIKCRGWGTDKPIPRAYYLDRNEVAEIEVATSKFNDIIAQKALLYDQPLIDVNGLLQQLTSGYPADGVTYSNQFIGGSAFSLDGIHLTPRGNALVANLIIDRINQAYQSTIPRVDPNQFDGVLCP